MTQDKERSSEKKLFQWHPANYAGLQIEFEDEKKYLSFEDEHQLGTKPMAIDILIIKNTEGYKVKKNIGHIFRKYNIIEYKSPDDYLSIDDFYKVYGYTCFYKADTPTVNQIEVNELTITFISRKYPRKLLRHLELERGFAIQKIESGIYYIVGDAIPIQFIVANKLSQTENLWLKGLTNQLHNYELTAALTKDYYEHKQNTLYESVMDIIMRANKKQFEEANNMCEAMKEFIWEHYGDEIMKEKQASFTNGTQNGERKVNTLIFKLSELGRIDDILKSATDTEYQQQLFKEFGL
jgi:hypothetical protein